MSERPPAGASTTPSLDGLLQQHKQRVPVARRHAVSRRALVERARSSGASCVVVTAPAGYGKTSLLAEWAHLERRRVAWLALDRNDDDASVLVGRIAAAVAPFSPGADEVARGGGALGEAPLEVAAPRLAACLAAGAESFALFLDDVHAIESPHGLEVLRIVLAGVPEGSIAVLAGREDRLPTAAARAEGRLFEASAADLAIDERGARAIFRMAGVSVSADELARIVAKNEGWAAGISLCAMIRSSGGDTDALTGDDPFIGDYLYEECVAGLPAPLRAFLLRSSILEELSAELCDAALGRTDSAAILRELARRNLFIAPLDRRGEWHRQHALMREFLQAELRVRAPEEIAGLHRRAGEWMLAHGMAERAFDHILRSGARARAAELVALAGLELYQSGRTSVVLRWIREVGEEAIVADRSAPLIAAWAAILGGRSVEAERWAHVLDLIDRDDDEFVSGRAMMRAAMCAGGFDRALEDARLAERLEPPTSPWRDQALHLLGTLLMHGGDVDAARPLLVEASRVAAVAGNNDTVVLAEADLALIALRERSFADAARRNARALEVAERNGMDGYSTTILPLVVGAILESRAGRRGRARALLARAMEVRTRCTHVLPVLAVPARLELAEAHLDLGEPGTASLLSAEVDELLRLRPGLGPLEERAVELRRRIRSVRSHELPSLLTPAERRLLPLLETHLTFAEIAVTLGVSRNTVGSHARAIYRKLAATSRGEAVRRARETGLLG